MNTIVSRQDFEKTIRSGVTLLDFKANWCAPCRAQEPILEKLAKQYDGKANIASMNIEGNNEVAVTLGVHSIPTLIIFKNGKELQRFVGLQPEDLLVNALESIINH